ncbi:DUF3392 domain-containing protein [Vibrio methylphosphonaticus]|uniref:DUF3392 domain-containing protein n=1 Tax=Vibrio methylphosphonaticus TaxID=2946866 RepID=UPI00202A4A66|nr:DUF3392 domain-containing protein [Vibrio methylphosphonaticus]MCL9774851.1 DUF3392 domain-containing protein [Vibrio methylphosphonaticus]
MLNIFAPGGQFISPYLFEVSTALVACVLVVLGADINRLMRNALRNTNFAIRTVCFILLNAFGYGLVIIKATPLLADVLDNTEPGLMFSIVVLSFVSIGIWAQRNRQI